VGRTEWGPALVGQTSTSLVGSLQGSLQRIFASVGLGLVGRRRQRQSRAVAQLYLGKIWHWRPMRIGLPVRKSRSSRGMCGAVHEFLIWAWRRHPPRNSGLCSLTAHRTEQQMRYVVLWQSRIAKSSYGQLSFSRAENLPAADSSSNTSVKRASLGDTSSSGVSSPDRPARPSSQMVTTHRLWPAGMSEPACRCLLDVRTPTASPVSSELKLRVACLHTRCSATSQTAERPSGSQT
jgi:hypothetical protein